ncbi:TPA: hypothetical protein QDA99_006572 [Burkholderia vietnamiensis]|uniref:DUF4376 domain-containing protein n=1 Tax=Burkholderia vietnamiensis TaxID=60552 RepID=UPI001588C223|nr:hypothetical protein [Burkholderia vietnamiensis]HDR9003065.1 hypothetical protein [Burkholderia vietnamiensis]HDR9006891.1 hypothetical protein [Burkholderia vietnamiensis]
MQNFIDTATQQLWAFDDDVIVEAVDGVYSFLDARGVLIDAPTTLQPHTPPTPTAAQLLSDAQMKQVALLSQACANAIIAGFSSSALGSACSYPSTLADQANQNTVAQCASGGMLWCAAGGVWSLKQHTQAQVQAVVSSFYAWLNKCQQQLVALKSQVSAATTVSTVESIAWTNPA